MVVNKVKKNRLTFKRNVLLSNAHHFDAVGGLLLLLDQETVRLSAGDVDPVPRGTGYQGRSNRLKVVTWILLLAAPIQSGGTASSQQMGKRAPPVVGSGDRIWLKIICQFVVLITSRHFCFTSFIM